MNTFLEKYKKAMDVLSKAVLIALGALACVMVLTIFMTVVTWNLIKVYPSWAEPLATVIMIYIGFIGAAVVYRERMHIGIMVFLQMMKPKLRNRVYFLIDFFIGLFSVFMIFWGAGFVAVTWNQTLSGSKLPVGVSYLPIPISGLCFLLFVFEKIMIDFSERKSGNVDVKPQGMEV